MKWLALALIMDPSTGTAADFFWQNNAKSADFKP
jgi:hypothetical protein